MRQLILVTLLSALVSSAAVKVDGNRIRISNEKDGVDVEWVRTTSFSVRHWWSAPPPPRNPLTTEQVEYRTEERESLVLVSTKFLTAEISKADFRISLRTAGGRPLFSDAKGVERTATTINVNQALPLDERIYGLGATTSGQTFDLRGASFRSRVPFFLSGFGYGRSLVANGAINVDVAKSDPLRLVLSAPVSDTFEHYIYFGPAPKEIFEEHMTLTDIRSDLHAKELAVLRTQDLPKAAIPIDAKTACGISARLGQLSLSGTTFPAIDVTNTAIPIDFLALFPILHGASTPARLKSLPELRRRWTHYLNAYFREAHDRGVPILRPLVVQFPLDRGLERRTDAVMIGDELLAFPDCDPKQLELPRGSWTDLRTNQRYPGRQIVPNDSPGMPLFAKSGSIIPLEASSAGLLELHYYPAIGAEFFVFEEDLNAYSQFHAAPVGDLMRLETESLVARKYRWIVHHSEKPAAVGESGRPYVQVDRTGNLTAGTWYYDADQRNLYVMVEASGNDDRIVNISFAQ